MEVKLQCFIAYALLFTYVYCENLNGIKNVDNMLDDKNIVNSTETNYDYSTSTLSSSQDFKKLTKKRCSRNYNTNCLKVDLISSVETLGKNTDFQLLPGIKLVSNSDLFTSQRASDTKMVFSADNISDQLDDLLIRRLTSYAKSLSINMQVLDDNQKKGKSLGGGLMEDLIHGLFGGMMKNIIEYLARSYHNVEGRAEKKPVKWGNNLQMVGVLTGGTLLWMGLSSLMVMAAKALIASLLSIVISCITAYKSSSHNAHQKSTTTYEIVAKPVYSPHAYPEGIQNDPHSAAAGQQYGRNMEWDKMASMNSRSEVPIRDDAHQLAYKAHVRPISKRNAF